MTPPSEHGKKLRWAKQVIQHYWRKPLYAPLTERNILDRLMLKLAPLQDVVLLHLCEWLELGVSGAEKRKGRGAWIPRLREHLQWRREQKQKMPQKG